MKYQEPVFDRTEEDITNRTSKAFFNVTDFERVYRNTEIAAQVVEYFTSQGISLTELDIPTVYSIPTSTFINSMIENIETVRQASGLPSLDGLTELFYEWAAGSGASAPDYTDANSWEQAIAVIMEKIESTIGYRAYCGVPAVGQARFYQNRWRLFVTGVPDSATPVRRARVNVNYCGTNLTRLNGFRRYD